MSGDRIGVVKKLSWISIRLSFNFIFCVWSISSVVISYGSKENPRANNSTMGPI